MIPSKIPASNKSYVAGRCILLKNNNRINNIKIIILIYFIDSYEKCHSVIRPDGGLTILGFRLFIFLPI
jgi:hypothetical protein